MRHECGTIPFAGLPRDDRSTVLTNRRGWVLPLLLGCAVTFAEGCRPSAPSGSAKSGSRATSPATIVDGRPTKPPLPRSDFVGTFVCLDCHREITESYLEHPMGRSSALIHEAKRIENYTEATSYNTADGRRYYVEERTDDAHGTNFWHHEECAIGSGEPLYDQAVKMELSIGSGRRGRSYGYLREDRFFQSPIGWYSSKNKWDMSPGYVPGIHQRFDRLMTDRCLHCHVGRLNHGSLPDTFDKSHPVVEAAIGCERCHGPAASHVERYRNPATFSGVDAIINPVKLDAVRRDAICHQCHMQASKTIARYGRQSQDFRPGDRLSDVWVVLNGSLDDRKAVTQSGQMLSSRCYVESGGKLGCVSCHNPHALPKGDPAEHFDARCAKCHGTTSEKCSLPFADRTDRTCIGCHMPRFPTSDIPHTALTDHRILRRPGTASRPASVHVKPSSYNSDVFDEGEPALPDWEVRRAQALALRRDRNLAKTPQDIRRAVAALRSLEQMLPDDPELFEMLAWLGSRQNDGPAVERAAKQTLELAPDRHESLELLMQALYARRAWSESEAVCRQMLALDEGKPSYHASLADLLFKQGRLAEGIEAAERSLVLDPTQRGVRQRLVEACLQNGDAARAKEHQAIVDQLPQPPRPK